MNILIRLGVLIFGYLIGTFQTGYFCGKREGIDIREHGSGNAGTTNTLRVLGNKAGAITFFGDFLKAVLVVGITYLVFKDIDPARVKIFEMYAGFGTVLGHNFPFYLKFKGGKGIACTAGVMCATCLPVVPLCLIVFVAVVAITRYVSLGSILVVSLYLIQSIIFVLVGWVVIEPAFKVEYLIIVACFTLMGIWRHRANIVRLANGTENKFGKKAA